VKALTQKLMLGSSAAGRGKGEVWGELTRACGTSSAARAVARGKPVRSMAIKEASEARIICLQTMAVFVACIYAPQPLPSIRTARIGRRAACSPRGTHIDHTKYAYSGG